MSRTVAKLGLRAVAVVIAVLLGRRAAFGDPLVITSGAFHTDKFSIANLATTLSPDISAGFYLGDADTDRYLPPYNCAAGACAGGTFNLSASGSYTRTPDADNIVVGGIFQAGGVLYLVQSVDYAVVAGSVIGAVDGSASTWFRFMATLSGTTPGGDLSRTLELFGSGNAGATWNHQNGWVSTNYTFADPAAVPEPASLLLLGTGLVGMGLRRWRTGRAG